MLVHISKYKATNTNVNFNKTKFFMLLYSTGWFFCDKNVKHEKKISPQRN